MGTLFRVLAVQDPVSASAAGFEMHAAVEDPIPGS
jgi:hypothetical protein